MARYLIDTHIFIFLITRQEDKLSRDVSAILDDYENEFLMSMETVRELIIAYRTGNLLLKFFKSAEELVDSIERIYHIRIVKVDMPVMRNYARLVINVAQEHKDPSDHIIISHAMTLGIPVISNDGKFPFYRGQGLQLIENR